MFFPPQLFLLDPKGLAGSLIEIWTWDFTISTASTNPGPITSSDIPQDRVLLLHSVQINATPGAGQLFQRAELADRNPANVQVGIVYSALGVAAAAPGAGVANYATDRQWNGYVMRPGHDLNLFTVFDLAGVANTVRITVQGWMIPRGKIGLAG